MVNKKQPDIRFSGFTDDWEQCEINDFGKQTFGGGTPKTSISKYWDGSVPWIQSSDVKEDVLKVTNPKKRISEDAIKSSATKLIPKDSIAVVTRVGVGKLALMDYDYATSQDFLSISGLRLDRWFATYSLYNILKREKNAVQGTSIKGLTKNDLLTKKVKIPKDRIEQGKIGVLLKQFDESISLHQQELTTLKQTKQGFLQKMFPKEGEKVPEVRFPGFNEDWEQRKLSEIVKLIGGNAFSSGDSSKEGIPWMKIANVSKNGIDWSNQSFLPSEFWDKYPDYRLTRGDYVMALTRPILNHALKIGKVDKPALLNQRVAKLDCMLNKEYTFQLLQRRTVVNKIENELAGTDPPNLGSKNLTNIDVEISKNIGEQQKIGSFFQQLDETIALHQRELELLQLT